MSTDPAPSGERIPHLMVGDLRAVGIGDWEDVDYRVNTACRLDRDVALVTSSRNQVRCAACRTADGDAAERDAMDRLAERWETGAANLVRAIGDGSSRHPSEVDTLMRCASELRQAMRAGRPGGAS